MGEILLRHYVIALIVFTMMVTGGVTLILSFQDQDAEFIPGNETDYFNRTFNIYEDIEDATNEVQNKVEESKIESDSFIGNLFTAMDLFIVSVWAVIKTMATSLSFVSIFGGISNFIGVSAWVGASITLMVTALIIFIIISVMFKKDI